MIINKAERKEDRKMKIERHERIRDIIENHVIETQGELLSALSREGISVTQATLSRDIRELGLVKVPMSNGQYRYAVPQRQSASMDVEDVKARCIRMFRDSVINMDLSENLIVLKTLPGAANVVASSLDHAAQSEFPEIIGTIAGDDNILVVIKPKAAAEKVFSQLCGFVER